MIVITGLVIAAGAALLIGAGMWLNRRENRADDARMNAEDAATLTWARELHHEEHDPGPTPIPASLHYRYGTPGDDGPAPYEKEPRAPAAERTPPAPPPPVHHDEYAPPQRWHPDPAAAVEAVPPALPPPPAAALLLLAAALRGHHQRAEARATCQRAMAVGAAINATEHARAQAWAAEVEATSPWKPRAPFTDWEHDSTVLAATEAEAT